MNTYTSATSSPKGTDTNNHNEKHVTRTTSAIATEDEIVVAPVHMEEDAHTMTSTEDDIVVAPMEEASDQMIGEANLTTRMRAALFSAHQSNSLKSTEAEISTIPVEDEVVVAPMHIMEEDSLVTRATSAEDDIVVAPMENDFVLGQLSPGVSPTTTRNAEENSAHPMTAEEDIVVSPMHSREDSVVTPTEEGIVVTPMDDEHVVLAVSYTHLTLPTNREV